LNQNLKKLSASPELAKKGRNAATAAATTATAVFGVSEHQIKV
jgi:hypothetical protein